MSQLSTLPVELIELILHNSSVEAIEALAATCRSIRRIVLNYDVEWQRLYHSLFATDTEQGEEAIWLTQTRNQLQSQKVTSFWWCLLLRRHRLEACWHGQVGKGLTSQLKRNLPLKRPPKVRVFTRPDWTLVTNGRKTCLVNSVSSKLYWLPASAAVVDTSNTATRNSLKTAKRLERVAEDDDNNLANMCIRAIALTDKYAAVKVSSIKGGHGRLRVWRIADRKIIIDQTSWSYYDTMEIRGRWLNYAEDLNTATQGRDRLVVLDLEASSTSKQMYRHRSPAMGMEAHLQRVNSTDALLFHNYYLGRTHYWCTYYIIAGDKSTTKHTMPLPHTQIYPGHATCIRVEQHANDDSHDDGRVLVYGRGDHRFGFTTWVSVLQLADNKLLWEQDVGFTPSIEGIDIQQVGGNRLVWPFGQQAVKILDLNNGNILYHTMLSNRSIISMIGHPVTGSLMLLALMNAPNDKDQCLMLNVQNGQLIEGPTIDHTISNRRTILAATTTHLINWDGKQLEMYRLS
ncbi:hypothetical protein BDF19DRAFT_452218 [Syncephalis fuscata]|nr:hypothetical protein BDF19DRAFT_452218 [Syncephalis fuscata]